MGRRVAFSFLLGKPGLKDVVAFVDHFSDALRFDDDPVKPPLLHSVIESHHPMPFARRRNEPIAILEFHHTIGARELEFLVNIGALDIDAGDLCDRSRVFRLKRLVDGSLDLLCGWLSVVTTASKKDAWNAKHERAGECGNEWSFHKAHFVWSGFVARRPASEVCA